MDERRQAAFAGLATLKRLDIMLSLREALREGSPVTVRLSHISQPNLELARAIAENWQHVKDVMGDQVGDRLGGKQDSFNVWEALALVASDIPETHKEILGRFDVDERLSRGPGALSFLASVKPRSELLKRRCIAAIRREGPDRWESDAASRAISILEEQFENHQQIAAQIAEQKNPFGGIELALAVLDPDHPYVRQMFEMVRNKQQVTVLEYFAVSYACRKAEDVARMLAADLDDMSLLHQFNHDDFAGAVIRRIKRDRQVRTIVTTTVLGEAPKGLKMNLVRLLDKAGFLTPDLKEFCVSEANTQIRTGMVEGSFDVVEGMMRGIPLALLDIINRNE